MTTAAAGMLASVALVATPAFAFRTAGDLQDFQPQTHVAFAKSSIEFEFAGNVPSGLDPALVKEELRRAGETWTAPGCTTLKFSFSDAASERAVPEDGKSTFQWVDDWRARGYASDSPGSTDVQYVKDKNGRWAIVEADVYLNLDFAWTTGVPTDERKSLQAVLTHELGHALGLLHPCELNGEDDSPKCSTSKEFATTEMFPVYSAEQTVLSADDVAGVCFLYPTGCNDSSCPDGTKCRAGSCEPMCGDDICAQGTQCVENECVATSRSCGDNCVGQPCTRPSDCGPMQYCNGGVCARGDGALGDPCTVREDCFDGACVDGSCAESCAPDSPCSDGQACTPETGACASDLKPMGARCKFSTDCRGGSCVKQDEAEPICTRSCGEGQPECPAGWGCRTADAQSVCVPSAHSHSGCTINPRPCSSAHFGSIMGLCFAFWRLSRRARLAKVRS